MSAITLVLILLLLVVISGFITRALPRPVPLPLVQIALGVLVATTTESTVQLDPHVFFLLFLPPLLFLDGWRIPKVGLMRDKGMVLELALGLVIFTVLGMGFFIHWMIPSMPLPVAFALAAVLSPTDPVAVSAIAARVPIPRRIIHILEGESLLNDASGLVCLRFAVAAALTGVFSLSEAFVTFLWLAAGGIGIGVAMTFGITLVKNWIAAKFGEESGSQILISLLLPFGAYIAAEHLGCSGILAAVAAGIAMGYAETSGKSMATTRVRRNIVWDAVQFTANGVIFILLGEQIPSILEGAVRVVNESGHHNAWWLVVYVLAITLALGVLRFLWVWTSVRFAFFGWRSNWQDMRKMDWRLVAVISVAGVRGAITLAGIMTLPLTMVDGTEFPSRDLAIFLAASVIILSLLLASFILPSLMKNLKLPPETPEKCAENAARLAAAQVAINAIKQVHHDVPDHPEDANLHIFAATRVMDEYRHDLEVEAKSEVERDLHHRVEAIEKHLHLVALQASRDEIFRLARTGMIDHDIMRKLVREIDMMEARYSG